jgi:uncharacterized protein
MNMLFDTPLLCRELLSAFPNALAIYAFGSQVDGTAGPDSDLDIAILVGAYANPLQLWETCSHLANLFNGHVDLLDLRAASTVMQHQVITTGQELWASQPSADLFACFVLNEKLDFDAARAGLLADIAREGKIHG